MMIHRGRAAIAALVLAGLGAVAGAGLAGVFLVLWLLARYRASSLAGILVASPGVLRWVLTVGVPAGAVLLPVLAFTLLRRVPLGRAMGYALGGAFLSVVGAAILVPRGPIWPAPALMPALAFAGLLVGAITARVASPTPDPRQAAASAHPTAA